ncbi:hypothetical protein AB6D11_00365 [Vibrio splendidus]
MSYKPVSGFWQNKVERLFVMLSTNPKQGYAELEQAHRHAIGKAIKEAICQRKAH